MNISFLPLCICIKHIRHPRPVWVHLHRNTKMFVNPLWEGDEKIGVMISCLFPLSEFRYAKTYHLSNFIMSWEKWGTKWKEQLTSCIVRILAKQLRMSPFQMAILCAYDITVISISEQRLCSCNRCCCELLCLTLWPFSPFMLQVCFTTNKMVLKYISTIKTLWKLISHLATHIPLEQRWDETQEFSELKQQLRCYVFMRH